MRLVIAVLALAAGSTGASTVEHAHALLTSAHATHATFVTAADVNDTIPPSGVNITTANGGSQPGRPEAGDSIVLSFSEPMAPGSIVGGWTGEVAAVVVRITDGGLVGADVLSVYAPGDTSPLPLGVVSLNATQYVSATRSFGETGTPSSMTLAGTNVTVVLGTASGATGTELVGADMTWTPTSSMRDVAGNACETTPVTENDGLLIAPEF